jgi:glycosyltransferase involved in cell wall biosynthesis
VWGQSTRRAPAAPRSRPLLALITGKSPLRKRGGLETYVKAHGLAGTQAGYDVHVFCVAARSRRIATEWGVFHEVASPVRPFSSFMVLLHGSFMRRAIVEHVRRSSTSGPTILHGFGSWSGIAADAADELEQAGIEAVPVASAFTTLLHEHRAMIGGLRREHGLFNVVRYTSRYVWVRCVADRVERHAYARARLVLVNYDSVRKLLVDSYGSGMRIRHIPYASDLAFAEADAIAPVPPAIARLQPADAPLVVSVSRHDPRKGGDVLIRALARLAHDGVPFRACLVGPGALLAANRALLAKFGLETQVTITGQVPEVRPYLQHADVFVLPSLEEGSGSLSLLEALQHGLPIIASGCDGIPEDIRASAPGEGTETGSAAEAAALLVDPASEQALVDALTRLVSDAPLRSRLAALARSIHEQRFSAAGFVEALRDVYAELGVSPPVLTERSAYVGRGSLKSPRPSADIGTSQSSSPPAELERGSR